MAAGAQATEPAFPTRPMRFVVPFPPGTTTDVVARLVALRAGERLGQQVVVDNRSGASGTIGVETVARAAPDGYTWGLGTTTTHALAHILNPKLGYDPVRDFAPVGQVGVTPIVLAVHPSVPARDVQSLVALLKANPRKYSYGSSGMGSILHLCGEQFKALAGGLQITHVPYRGSAPMMGDLVGGQISMAFDATPTAMPQAQSGAIRALGAGTAERMRAMPELATLSEQGLKGFDCYTWNAILAPAGTPPAIVDKLAAAIVKALEDPVVFRRLQEAGVDPTPGRGPKETADFIKAELAKWAPIIKASGAQVTN